jgi:D-amino peptidase
MKLYLIVDMEGMSGIVSPEQIDGSDSWEADRARRQCTAEVLTVCEAAVEAGVDEIVINDFHGKGRNLLPEKLPQCAFIIQGDFRPTSGWDFLDGTFTGVIFLGAHGRTGSQESVLPHTYSEKLRFELFGQSVGEVDILALLAGEQKVPTILVSGDSKTLEQIRTNLPSAHTVITKMSIGPQAALSFHPTQLLETLREEVKQALKNVAKIEPPGVEPPIPLVIRCQNIQLAERLDWIPGLKRIDNVSFEFSGENMKQIAKLIYGVTELASSV